VWRLCIPTRATTVPELGPDLHIWNNFPMQFIYMFYQSAQRNPTLPDIRKSLIALSFGMVVGGIHMMPMDIK
jgi:hypothetical protein